MYMPYLHDWASYESHDHSGSAPPGGGVPWGADVVEVPPHLHPATVSGALQAAASGAAQDQVKEAQQQQEVEKEAQLQAQLRQQAESEALVLQSARNRHQAAEEQQQKAAAEEAEVAEAVARVAAAAVGKASMEAQRAAKAQLVSAQSQQKQQEGEEAHSAGVQRRAESEALALQEAEERQQAAELKQLGSAARGAAPAATAEAAAAAAVAAAVVRGALLPVGATPQGQFPLVPPAVPGSGSPSSMGAIRMTPGSRDGAEGLAVRPFRLPGVPMHWEGERGCFGSMHSVVRHMGIYHRCLVASWEPTLNNALGGESQVSIEACTGLPFLDRAATLGECNRKHVAEDDASSAQQHMLLCFVLCACSASA